MVATLAASWASNGENSHHRKLDPVLADFLVHFLEVATGAISHGCGLLLVEVEALEAEVGEGDLLDDGVLHSAHRLEGLSDGFQELGESVLLVGDDSGEDSVFGCILGRGQLAFLTYGTGGEL